MNKQQPLLQINNLSLAYGAKEILKSVQLTVCPGEILGIVGSSGGGKSTLLKTLTGLLPANAVITGGEILWQGRSLLSGGRLNSSGLLGRKLSMIFQDPTASLYPLQTIGSQICTMLQAQGQFDNAASLQSAAQVLAGLDFSKPQADFKQLSVSAFGRHEPAGLYRYGTFAEAGAVTGRRTDLWT